MKLHDENSHLEESDKKYLWHPFTQMREWERETPLIIERGEGNYLIDTNIFLEILLNQEKADECEKLLNNIKKSRY